MAVGLEPPLIPQRRYALAGVSGNRSITDNGMKAISMHMAAGPLAAHFHEESRKERLASCTRNGDFRDGKKS